MKLTDILIREACIVDLRARTKKETVQELAGAMAAKHPLDG